MLDKMKFMGSWGTPGGGTLRIPSVSNVKHDFWEQISAVRLPPPSHTLRMQFLNFVFRHFSPSGHSAENKIRTFSVFLCHCMSLLAGCVLPSSSSSSCLVIHLNFSFVDVRLAFLWKKRVLMCVHMALKHADKKLLRSSRNLQLNEIFVMFLRQMSS